MLALLYGLLGEFRVGLLLLRIEETAIGAVIGIAAAMLVLPVNSRARIRSDAHTFFLTLSDLVDASVTSLLGGDTAVRLTETARQLGRDLQQFRTTAKPMSAGLAGLAGRRSMRHGLRMLTACERYGRILAHSGETHISTSPELADAIKSTATQIRRNIDVLITSLEFNQAATVFPSTDYIDAAETLARQNGDHPPSPDLRRLLAALHALRQIDRVIINAAIDLGADNGALLPSPVSDVES
ncbi:MAG: FUSC family protein, partial [Mycobacterium sp.]